MVKISRQNIAKKYPTTPVVYNLITLVRWFIIGGRAWASMHCWFNILSWYTNHG